jgi:replication factor A1
VKITKVSFSRKYNLGNYETLDVGAEAELTEQDNPLEAWSILRDNAEMWFIDQQRKKDAEASGAQTPSPKDSSVKSAPASTPIATLKEGDKKVSVTAKVAGVETPRKTAEHIVQDVTIQDATGIIKLVLWDDDVGKATMGNMVKVENGYVSAYKGTLQLNVGKYGKLTVTQP